MSLLKESSSFLTMNYEPRTTSHLSTKTAILLIALFFIVAYIIQLGAMSLVSPDEPRYAEIPREMIVSGNWIVPQFNGIDYFQKPVLGYWLTAVSELLFGYSNFAVRFPSALCTGLTALLIYVFVRRFMDDKTIALFSALIFLSFGMVFGIGCYSVLDAQTSFFLAGSLIAFYFAYQSKLASVRFVFLVLCGFSVGLCFMIKGFLAFAVLVIAVAPFLIWEKQWKRLFTMPWIPIMSAIGICIPWGIKMWNKAPDFWAYFIVVEHYNRFFRAGNFGTDLHPKPFWFFIPILLAGMLPWTIHLPSAILGFKTREALKTPLIRYSLSWLIFPFFFFSASSGKLATYILPCFPPLAVLTAYGLHRYLIEKEKTKFFDIVNLSLLWMLLTGIIGAAGYVIVSRFAQIPRLWNFIQLNYALGIFTFMIIMMIFSLKTKNPTKKILFFTFAPLLAFGFKSSVIPTDALSSKQQGDFVLKQSKYITSDTIVIAYPNMMHAVSWYLKRNDLYIYGQGSGGGGELEYWLKQPKFQGRYINGKQQLRKFIDENKNRKDGLAFFMRGDFREDIPASSTEDYRDGMMFSKFSGK